MDILADYGKLNVPILAPEAATLATTGSFWSRDGICLWYMHTFMDGDGRDGLDGLWRVNGQNCFFSCCACMDADGADGLGYTRIAANTGQNCFF